MFSFIENINSKKLIIIPINWIASKYTYVALFFVTIFKKKIVKSAIDNTPNIIFSIIILSLPKCYFFKT